MIMLLWLRRHLLKHQHIVFGIPRSYSRSPHPLWVRYRYAIIRKNTTTVQYQSSYISSGFFLWASQNSLRLFPHLLKIIPSRWPPHWRINVPPDTSTTWFILTGLQGSCFLWSTSRDFVIREPNSVETLESRRNDVGSHYKSPRRRVGII